MFHNVTIGLGMSIQGFDVIITNPPFQDTEKRGRTPHKLWIDFTRKAFRDYLAQDGWLCQVSPSSFCSPNSRVLELMRDYETSWISFDTSHHFPYIGSSFSHYSIRKCPSSSRPVPIYWKGQLARIPIDQGSFYLPTDLTTEGLSVHKKVIFDVEEKLKVEWDYVTCHNIKLKKSNTLSKERTEHHVHPVLHTNRQTWWSSVRQSFSDSPKVMWSRSGYTRPFYDPGELGGTDMAYFVRVDSEIEGKNLAHNLNTLLLRYIYHTARWSGYGNERVFAALPDLPREQALDNIEVFDLFQVDDTERRHIERTMGSNRAEC